MLKTILRLPAVMQHSGLSRSSVYQNISRGTWPKPVLLGARSVGWPSDEIEAVNDARIAGKSDAEIQELVRRLQAARQGMQQ